jgi:hypothetical protein
LVVRKTFRIMECYPCEALQFAGNTPLLGMRHQKMNLKEVKKIEKDILYLLPASGCSVARYRASMGCWRSEVRIFSSRLLSQKPLDESLKAFFAEWYRVPTKVGKVGSSNLLIPTFKSKAFK